MWKLKHTKKEHLDSFLFVGDEFVVGRKDASLLITSDPSVSRRHAVLYLKHPEENLSDPSKKSSLFLRDEGSKYGTFKNNSRISAEVQLEDNDLVKFGQFNSEFKIHCVPLLVTTSCLQMPAKRELRRTVHALGGHLISEWQPACSHLVMSEVKITVKALCCLVSAKPIILPEYFQELMKSLKATATFVPPNRYIPPSGEALIDKDKVSFDVSLQRKTLFEGRTFFFLDEKQFKKLHLSIILGGGNASILTCDNLDPDKLLQEGCCVIDPMKESQSSLEIRDFLPTVISTLQKKKLRLIPESDIGLAVAYSSTEQFCNPTFHSSEVLVSSRIQSQTLTQREVYVPNTEEKIVRREPIQSLATEACSSLHLSSFNIGVVEEMPASEIPLSAQVKRELDDIFDDPVEVENILPPISNTLPSVASPSRPSKRQKRSVNHPSEISSMLEIQAPKECNDDVKPTVCSPEQKPTVTAIGRDSPIVNNYNHLEENLPRNLMKIEFVSLICKRPVPAAQQYRNSSVKNFKKFKKVQPKRAQALPRIIGAHELIPYDKIAAEVCNNTVWDDPPEVEASQPVKGEFDW